MNKTELRKLYLQKRLALTEAAYLHLSSLICERFFSSVDLSLVKVIHTFLPARERREPDTWLLIDRIRKEFPHIRVSLPKISARGQLENIYFEGLHQLQKNSWGIEEPKQGVPTPLEEIDLVLVPLLCFDKDGNRVGYGKGYYDRFLACCKPYTKKIGISFFEAVDLIDDVDKFDVLLNAALTPYKSTSF